MTNKKKNISQIQLGDFNMFFGICDELNCQLYIMELIRKY